MLVRAYIKRYIKERIISIFYYLRLDRQLDGYITKGNSSRL